MLNLSLYFICMTCCCTVGLLPFLSLMRRTAAANVCNQDAVSSREDVWDASYSQSVVVPPKLFFRLIIGSSCLLRTDGFILSRGFFCCILPYLILSGKPKRRAIVFDTDELRYPNLYDRAKNRHRR